MPRIRRQSAAGRLTAGFAVTSHLHKVGLMKTLMLLSALLFSGLLYADSANSAAEAVEIAKRRAPGQVLSVDTQSNNAQTIYVVRILTSDGRVRRISINASQ